MTTVEQVLGRKPIHPFPARMAPSIALDALGETREKMRVLDPMVGSGTVVAVAKSRGHRAFGIDCDPLSVLNATVWTRGIDPSRVKQKAKDTLDRARSLFDRTPARDAYPSSADEETRRFLRYWYDQVARRELYALSAVISRIKDKHTREALWSAFSRMIIAKQAGVSLAMDLSHSRPHKVYSSAPVRPFDQFLRSVSDVVDNCPTRWQRGAGPPSNVKLGDCRKLPFQRESFDLVLTSPPYLNAIDYIRCSKFSLVWMGHRVESLRTVRSESVGSECTGQFSGDNPSVSKIVSQMTNTDSLSKRTERLLSVYVSDMARCLSEVSRVLRVGGKAVLVIGDNQIREVFISNSNAIKAIAGQTKLVLDSEITRDLPPNRRYLPPPSSHTECKKLQSRMRSEVVLTFKRCS